MNTRAWLRRLGFAALLGVLCVSGWGWVRVILSVSQIARHERILSMQAGSLVAQERRLQELEAMLGVRYPSGDRKRSTADLVCSAASGKRAPVMLEVYSDE